MRRQDKFNIGDIVEIIWQDVETNMDWLRMDEVETQSTATVKTVGYFLRSTKKLLQVAWNYTKKEFDVITIPWVLIDSIKLLKKAEKWQQK